MSAVHDLAATIGKVIVNLEGTVRLFESINAELGDVRREVDELRRGLAAVTEQLITENDLIGATQDFATRQDIADLEATVRDLVAPPSE